MQRRYLLVLLALSFGLVPLLVHGCSMETGFESVCDWVADPNNCYREFRAGMLAATNPSAGSVNGDCTFTGTSPTQVDVSKHTDGTPNGAFQTTGMLGTCVISTGGSVVVNPPITLAAYPPSLESTPVTYQMAIMDASGNTCGTLSYTSPHGFAITINPQTGIGGSGGGSSGSGGGFAFQDAGGDGAFEATPEFGTYTETIAPGLDDFDVTCPSGETHHFNLDESGDAVQPSAAEPSSCPGYAALVPSASLQVDPGGIDRAGAVSFAIVYPNTTATYPPFQSGPDGDGFDPDATDVPKPVEVVYFNCSVPAAPPQCMDGVKDGMETDVDCGGPAVNGCPARCGGGLGCLCNGDCASDLCFVDPMSGMRVCYDPTNPPTGSNGAPLDVGQGVGVCSYLSICNGTACSSPKGTCCTGSCVDTASDPNNCGGCGQVCCGATPVCKQSACAASPDAGSDAGSSCPDAGPDAG
jgi:hypothetical protein